jgi:hypothetical protein
MPLRCRLLFSTALVLLGACSAGDSGPAGPEPGLSASKSGDHGADRLTVMTQNLYPGANLDLVIGALVSPDPNDDVPALQFALQTFQETDYPTRAAALADEIARDRPHAVGLQEVFTFDLNVDFGTPVSLYVPFLPILADELAKRGLNYTVAAENLNFELEPVPGIKLSDRDVLLIDADRVQLLDGAGRTFTANLGDVGGGLVITRGWVMARVSIDGQFLELASAHTESGNSPGLDGLRALQIGELVSWLPTNLPVVFMGDLNDVPGSLMYQILRGAGFTDLWKEMHPGAKGYTCCHADNLSDHVPRFDQRIDYVWSRGFGRQPVGVQGQISLFGDHPSDRFPGPVHPLWISDHAGILATIMSPPGRSK